MLIDAGLRNHLMQALPKRTFDLLIDPSCLDSLRSSTYRNLFQLLLDLRLLNPPIDIKLLVTDETECPPPFTRLSLSEDETVIAYTPINPLKDDPRPKLVKDVRLRNLCALAIHLRVDGLVTTDPTILDARYALQHDLITIVPIQELEDFVEICAHGHNVFWSASCADAVYQDVYYILRHPKCKRLAEWWGAMQARATSAVAGQLRSIIMNRYQFILYARDMIRFGRLQKDYYGRHGEDRLGFAVSYHVNQFYFLLWGTLDHLALLSNEVLSLGLKEKQCGIASKDFLKALGNQRANINRFLLMPSVNAWINRMSDFRHSVAHQIIPIPTQIVIDTEDSRKPTEEIVMLLDTEPQWQHLKDIPNQEIRRYLTDWAVLEWRHKKRSKVADHMVLIKDKSQGYYYWSPVISVDHDLATLTGIMDAFFVGLFSQKHELRSAP